MNERNMNPSDLVKAKCEVLKIAQQISKLNNINNVDRLELNNLHIKLEKIKQMLLNSLSNK